MKKKPVLRLLVLLLVLLTGSGIYLVARLDNEIGYFTPSDKEYYLSPEEILFIRPGLELEILDVSIPGDLKPTVTYSLKDPGGLPLDQDGVFTPGQVSVSFVFGYIPQGERQYLNYYTALATSSITGESAIQGSRDRSGTYAEVGDGVYTYTYGEPLPGDYDQDATHTMGVYARRDLTEFGLSRYVANELEHFVPSGVADPEPRSVVTTETCNSRCHDPLALHGGSRQEIGLCVLCHNPQSSDPDTGNTVDFKVMVHKIHMGEDLPSVQAGTPYQIIGFRNTVHDYSEVEIPADIRDCQLCHTPGLVAASDENPLVLDPNPIPVCDGTRTVVASMSWNAPQAASVEIRANGANGKVVTRGDSAGSANTGKWVVDGTTFFLVDADSGDVIGQTTARTTVLGCTGAAPGSPRGMAGTQWDAWFKQPSRATCGSCHDDVNFETGEGHSVGIPQESDEFCGVCHQPGGRNEYDITIKGAHTVPYKSHQLNGVLIRFIEIQDTGPGQTPTVIYALSNKRGPIHPGSLGRLRFTMVGPNEDYSWSSGAEDVRDDSVRAGAYWSYTFKTPLPMDAKGSYTMGAEGRVNSVVLNPGTPKEFSMRDTAQNPVMAFPVTDEAAVPRRKVVADEKCEACHGNLSEHGSNRHDPQYCVTCHVPGALERPSDEPQQSIHFKYMIHKLHSGAHLERGFFVGGHDFGHVEFPGDLSNCEKCHVNDSYELPLPDGLLSTITNWDFFSPTLPTAAACLSCHDSQIAAAHADSMTSTLAGEACAACHGSGAEFAVERVHAR